MFCDVKADSVIAAHNAKSIYDIPLILEQQGMDRVICNKWFTRVQKRFGRMEAICTKYA